MDRFLLEIVRGPGSATPRLTRGVFSVEVTLRLQTEEVRIAPVALKQLPVAAELLDAAVVQHRDAIRHPNRREAV